MNRKTRTVLAIVAVVVMLAASNTFASAQSECDRVIEQYGHVVPRLSEARNRLLANGNLDGAANIQEQINAWDLRVCGACPGSC